MAKEEKVEEKRPDVRVDTEQIARKTVSSEQVSHAIKTAAADQTILDVDDFDEGIALGTTSIPPGVPKSLRGKGGKEVPVIPIRLAKATCTQHRFWPYVVPVTPENSPNVPKRFFNAAGELQMGDLIVCLLSKNIYDKMKAESRKPFEDMVKKWNKGGRDYGHDKGPVTATFPNGEKYSGGVWIRGTEN